VTRAVRRDMATPSSGLKNKQLAFADMCGPQINYRRPERQAAVRAYLLKEDFPAVLGL